MGLSKTDKLIVILGIIAIIFSIGIYLYETNLNAENLIFGNEKFSSNNIEVYFCPNEKCDIQILKKINSAKESVYCAVYSFTSSAVGEAIVLAKNKGLDVRLIFDSQQISQYSEYGKLFENGLQVIKDKNSKLMHNKFCVFDKGIVLTGSANFSENGFEGNNENIMFVESKEIAKKYLDEFDRLWEEWN